jgi:hypothetical protein
MTSQLPDDMFIENSPLPAQLAAGNASPQPGIVVDEESPRRAPSGAGANAVVVAALIGTALVALGGVAVFWLASGSDEAPVEEEPVASASNESEEIYPIPNVASTTYDRYIAMADDESIFQIIPRTDEGWDYFRAFMYKITDFKIAESIGGPLTVAQVEEMKALEARFWSLQDLDLTVDVTLSDGTHFEHDGHAPAREEVATPPA